MFRSILTTALRNILRNRSFSLINMVGLSVSMSLALLVILIIREQYTYDNFHRDADRIYRVNTRALRVAGGSEDYASAPLPIARIFREEYTFAEEVVSLNRRFGGDVTFGNVNVPVNGLFVDPSFLTVFNFPLEKGNPASALNEPNSLILTQASAKRIFGDQEALGQTVSVSGYGEFVITGVLKEFQSKTHFEFQMLGSMNAVPGFEAQNIIGNSIDNWNNYYGNYIYFKLREGKNTEEVEKALTDVVKKHYATLKLETRDRGYEFFLMSLSELSPGPEMSNRMGNGMPDLLILFLSILVGIVMLMACFNYTNLMIAKSLSRAREIGVRKVVGAQRIQVFLQFVGEAVVFSLISLAFSYLFLQLLKPAYHQLNMAREFDVELKEDYLLYLLFFGFAVLIGVVAGLLPAGYLSAFRPVSVLKDSGNLKVYSRLTFRKVLIVTQFTFSVVFVIVVLVIYKQINFMVTTDYGLNDKNLLNVRLQGMEFQKLANEVKALPGVVSVGGVSHPLGTWADRSSDYKKNLADEPFVMRDFIVDDNYINNVDLKFLAGHNFVASEQGQQERHIVLNEQSLKLFGFNDPIGAIGQPVYTDDSLMLTVIGVVKDFHFRPLSYQIGPVALRYKFSSLGYLSARIVPSQKDIVVASIESIWKKLDPIHPIEWKMMDEEIDEAYQQGGFFDVLNIVGYISFLAVSLACLGMLGMAMYSTQTRFKEIGVRKVMGASSRELTVLLSRTFIILLGIACIIGIPIGYFLGEQFLNTYAYKIQISPLLILSGIALVGGLGILTICSQTWRAASSNPVKSLRYE
jgi:putative ABC transport system permease protein